MGSQVLALTAVNQSGKRIKLKSILVPEKQNVLFFHASWSKTSSRYKVELSRWQEKHDDTVIHLVDVKTLKSPVSKQFKLKSVPYFLIYDKEGKLAESGQAAQNTVAKMLAD